MGLQLLLVSLWTKVPLFVVSGNHDGAERLEVGRSMLSRSGIHIWVPLIALQPF